MNIFLLLSSITCVVGGCADAWTTYWGLYILKQDVEGDQNWFAQWETGSKLRCLVVKPAVSAGLTALVVLGLKGIPALQIAGAALMAAVGVRGLMAGWHNWKINIAQSGGKL